jgi:ribose transport system ATP-binding protein
LGQRQRHPKHETTGEVQTLPGRLAFVGDEQKGLNELNAVPSASRAARRHLTATGLRKSFDGVEVLHGVDLELRGGEVHALVGENGAGKSTIMNILSGKLQPDAGTLALNGQRVAFRNPHAALRAGISSIAQELHVVPTLTVLENIFLGVEPTRLGVVLWADARREAVRIMARLGVDVDPKRVVGTMSMADQQLVEIAKAMNGDFSMLIMDEPTSALNLREIERLFDVIKALKESGIGVLYISHRLWEIFEIADQVTVVRDGRCVFTKRVAETNVPDVVRGMLGHERLGTARRAKSTTLARGAVGAGEAALDVDDITAGEFVKSVSISVAPGEIVGLAGVLGSGRTELCEAIFGVRKIEAGTVRLRGREAETGTPMQAIAAGIFMVAEDRKAAGIIADLDVCENVVLNCRSADGNPGRAIRPVRSASRIRARLEARLYETMRKSLGIRSVGPRQPITSLSGGNQQKALFARAALAQPDVLLLCEPTRGVDVGAKEEIYSTIERFADDGAAVLVSSSEVTELLRLADRVLVMRDGSVMGEFLGNQTTEDEIVQRMAG